MDAPKLPKTILCPIDLSDLSSAPLRFSGALARDLNADLCVLHAHTWAAPIEFLPGQEQYFMAEIKMWEASTGKIIEDFAKPFVGDVPFQACLSEMSIVDAVVSKANEIDADLIVMGTHGRSGINRVVAGSVAEDVIRVENRPVMVVRKGLKPPDPPEKLFKRIVCPINFTEVAKDALRYSLAVANHYSAELTVIYSIENSHEAIEAAKEKLEAWTAEVTERQCHCEIVAEIGHASERIIHFVKDNACDLIVIGAQKKPILETILFGTTTEQVMHNSPSPVLVIPRHIVSS